MKLLALVVSSALISTATFASDTFNFDYVGAGYAKFKLEDADSSLNGFTVEASKQLNENWAVSTQYMDTSHNERRSSVDEYYDATVRSDSEEKFDIAQWQLSAAYLIPLEQNTLLEFVGTIGRMTFDYDHFYEQTIVQNKTSNSQSSLYGEPWHYEDRDHTSTLGFEAYYHVALLDNFKASAGLGYQHIKDADEKNELVYQFELAYDITNDFTISATYRNVDVYENHFVTVRYNF
ncbi:hypothetical protein [Pseudoalteromonas umbrosa]|uniref:hypothetical protein n=1 Tax=Pseudoalteromonas umbrosa TaxID=3048489 RepID=UPI0024C38CBA|nr:hypothetical protein [Pseudoalteromonas sp. B95]MDK1288403.1 hypothetical protein [Pseudoalteromonas sp. B95]